MPRSQEPRWLSPEQTAAWLALIGTTVWLPAALDAQLQRDAGISHVEYVVLSWLSMSPGRTARMSAIAARSNVSLSHLSRIAARLEKRGWMRRTPDPDDGRATLATLTDAGWDKVVDTAPAHAEQVQRLVFDGLSAADVRHLERIAARILRAANPDLPARELPVDPPVPTTGADLVQDRAPGDG